MKQAVLTFDKCQVVLIESDRGSKDVFRMKDPPKRMKLIGKLSELTEEQFAEIVNWNEKGQYYTDYQKAGWQGDIFALESFLSKMRAEGYTAQENPKVLRDSENSLSAGELERNFRPSQTWVFTIKPTPIEGE